jgi:hypothetical protein
MKSIISILSIIFILLCFSPCSAQQKSSPQTPESKRVNLEGAVLHSEVIIEGHSIGVKCFKARGRIYTSDLIKITKIFKGDISDSTIELIFEGGQVDGIGEFSEDGGDPDISVEGVFFLHINQTDVKLKPELQSYSPDYCIGYHNGIHRAVWGDVPYDDMEKDIFQVIEATTGQKRKVLGPNMFELPTRKK